MITSHPPAAGDGCTCDRELILPSCVDLLCLRFLSDSPLLLAMPDAQKCAETEYAIITDLEIRAVNVQSAFTCEGVGKTITVDGGSTYGSNIAGLTYDSSAASCFNMDAATPGLGDGSSRLIVEAITCANTVTACNILYRVAFGCAPLPTYSWTTTEWSTCSATACGTTGTQTRTATCKASDPSPATPADCAVSAPATLQSCSADACSSTGATDGSQSAAGRSSAVDGLLSTLLIAGAAAATQLQ